jgi:hypothetical protein
MYVLLAFSTCIVTFLLALLNITKKFTFLKVDR